MQNAFTRLECIRCGTRAGNDQFHAGCPTCTERGKPSNLSTVYDVEKARTGFVPSELIRRPKNMWRYDSLLPFTADQAVSLDEGATPLLATPRLAKHLGIRRLWIKDESRNPTWSFKDRSAAVGATHALLLKSPALVISSTGNAAAATAAYGHRAGLPVIVLFAKNVDPIMSAFVRAYGAYVVMTPTKPDRWTMVRHCVEEWGCYPAGNYVNPPVGLNPFMNDGYKTIGFEIWEQLGYRAPDWIFGPAGHTDCLYGVFKSFRELKALGLAGSPRLGAAEIYGSLSRAIEEGRDTVEAATVDRTTVAFSMATAQNTYQGLVAVRESGGLATQVSDGEILAAQRLLLESEGVFGETASVTGLAALVRRINSGQVERDAEVVVVVTSTGLKSLGVTGDAKAEVPIVETVQQFSNILKGRYGFDPGAL